MESEQTDRSTANTAPEKDAHLKAYKSHEGLLVKKWLSMQQVWQKFRGLCETLCSFI